MAEARLRFHLAFPVDDLPAARAFYEGVLGATVGRTSDRWIDFSFWGHQLTAHLAPRPAPAATNQVDADAVPVRHFGVILPWPAWESLAQRITDAAVPFLIEPHVRFAGQVGEQATLFVVDPAGNALEFKSFRDEDQVFST